MLLYSLPRACVPLRLTTHVKCYNVNVVGPMCSMHARAHYSDVTVNNINYVGMFLWAQYVFKLHVSVYMKRL